MIDHEIIEYIPQLLYGTAISLLLALGTAFIGTIGGIILAILQTQSNKFFKAFVSVYVALFRGTPMLIQITFFYIALGYIYNISAFTAALISIGLNSSAYVSQIIKSGISSVSVGQIEAAKTLGINRYDQVKYIILPQAIRVVIPSLANEFITLIKDSSLASTIGVMELFKQANVIISRTYDPIPIYIVVGGIYLIITTIISLIINYVEKRLQYN